MRELLLEIWISMRRNKLRTALTGFSVAWGIFMLVILLGSGNGLKNGVMSSFGNMSTNSIELWNGYTSKPYMGYDKHRRIRLRNSDLTALKQSIKEIDQVTAMGWFDDNTATYGRQFIKTSLQGVLPKIEQIKGLNIVAGRFINDTDIRNYRKVVVIQQNMQQVLFKGEDPIGKQINIGNSTYTVAGVCKQDENRIDALAYIPLTTGQLIFKGSNTEISSAIITIKGVNNDEQMKALDQNIRNCLASEHYFDPTDTSAIWLQNTMEIFKSMSIVFNGINIFVWIIGLGTLFAGVVGVSNIMLVTVSERTAEFGIRKALGAQPSSIIRLILTESVLITSLFGYIGMVLGVGVMEVVNMIIEQMPADTSQFGGTIFLNPTLDLSVAVSATVVLVLAGLVAGYVPAYRAAQLKTIDALRYNK